MRYEVDCLTLGKDYFRPIERYRRTAFSEDHAAQVVEEEGQKFLADPPAWAKELRCFVTRVEEVELMGLRKGFRVEEGETDAT